MPIPGIVTDLPREIGDCPRTDRRGRERARRPAVRERRAGAAFQELPRSCLTAEEYPIMIPDDGNANGISYGRLPDKEK